MNHHGRLKTYVRSYKMNSVSSGVFLAKLFKRPTMFDCYIMAHMEIFQITKIAVVVIVIKVKC